MVESFPNKKDLADKLLSEAMSVFLHLDPRRQGVVVPPQFKRQPGLVLEFGLNMAVPIRDLEVTDEGIGGTLSFNRSPFWCFLPWDAVFAMVSSDQRGAIWPSDVPDELLDKYLPGAARGPRAVPDDEPEEQVEQAPEAERPRPKPRLAVAPEPEEAEEEEEETRGEDSESSKPADTSTGGTSPEAEGDSRDGGDGKKKRKLPPYLRVVK